MPRKEDYESGKPYLDLPDYSGPFIEGLRYEDFSKERLAALYNAAGKLFLSIDNAWARHIEKKYGWEEALEGHIKVWTEGMSLPEWACMYEGLGMMGQNDLEAIMKHNQFDPGWPYPLFEVQYEMPDKEHGIITCYKCSAVDYWERKGDVKKLCDVCYKMEPAAFENYIKVVNPNVTSRPLFRPPRKSVNDPCCKWEITYVENAKKEWGADWENRDKLNDMTGLDYSLPADYVRPNK